MTDEEMKVIYSFKNRDEFKKHDFEESLRLCAHEQNLQLYQVEIYLEYINDRYEIIVSEPMSKKSWTEKDNDKRIGYLNWLTDDNIFNEFSIDEIIDNIEEKLHRDLIIISRKNNIKIFMDMRKKVLEKIQNHKELLEFAKQPYTIIDGIQKITNLEKSISRQIYHLEQQYDNKKELKPDNIITDLCNTMQYFDDISDPSYYFDESTDEIKEVRYQSGDR
jgi:hypothetical protein